MPGNNVDDVGALTHTVLAAAMAAVSADHATVCLDSQLVGTDCYATGEVAELVHILAAELLEGPFIDALAHRGVIRVDDLSKEARWPLFTGAALVQTPVRSVLSFRLSIDARLWGVVSVLADRPNAFSVDSEKTVLLACHAALTANRLTDNAIFVQVQGRAKQFGGAVQVLMNRYDLSADEAWSLLNRIARESRKTIPAVARELVAAGAGPGRSDVSSRPKAVNLGRAMEPTAQAAVAAAGILHGVDPSSAAALVEQLRLVDYQRGDLIYAQNDAADHLYIVVSGKVKLVRRGIDDREQLLSVFGPSEMFGVLSMFDPGPRIASAHALTDVCLAIMDHVALRIWLTTRPAIAEQLLRVLARRLRRTDDQLSDLIFTDVSGRVAKALLSFAQRFGTSADGAIRVDHDLTQSEIAQLVGASRETVNKALSTFIQRGWITVNGATVIIHDTDGLAHRAR